MRVSLPAEAGPRGGQGEGAASRGRGYTARMPRAPRASGRMATHVGSAVGAAIPAHRLVTQQLAAPAFASPAGLVAWFGAVQAQDPAAARWAVALRLRAATTEADLARALAEGTILRTHALRGTWHLVVPGDARDLLALSAPRVLAGARSRHRELGLDAATVKTGRAAIARALRGGHQTREALRAALERAHVSTEGQRLSHLLMIAELQAIAVSGAPVDGQPTHAAFDERVPARREPFDREDALARLALRYARSRGPVTAEDLAWFAGVGKVEARRALAASRGPLVEDALDGRTVWRAADAPSPPAGAAREVHLLPAFDEYLVAYRHRRDVLDPRHARTINAGGGLLDPIVVAGGLVVGTWRRVLGRKGVALQVETFGALTPALRADVEAAAERYGAFVGLAPELTFSRLGRGAGLPRRSR